MRVYFKNFLMPGIISAYFNNNIHAFIEINHKTVLLLCKGVAGYPRTVLHAILDNAPNLPGAFSTLLTLIRDSRLSNPLLRYLKTNHFFTNFIKDNLPSPAMDAQDIGYLLKCVAVELKTTTSPGPLAKSILGDGSSKFQEILNLLELDDDPVELPELEFFDQDNVMQVNKINSINSCCVKIMNVITLGRP